MKAKLNTRVLIVFTIVALPLLVVAGVLTLGTGKADLRDAYGRQLTQMAELVAAGTDAYVYRRIIDAAVLARTPTVRQAAVAANEAPFSEGDVMALDSEWQGATGVPRPLGGLLTSSTSRFLLDITRQDPVYREILVTDRHGRLVAASNRTSDYFQADEEWWQDSFSGGVRGQLSVSGVLYDESARSEAIQIAAPITEESGDNVLGVLKVIVDIRELAALVDGMHLGDTGGATLVRPDGSIVLSRQGAEPSSRFFAADALRERLESRLQAGGSPYQLHFSAMSGAEPRLLGVAQGQLGSSYRNLDWLVVVSQAERELFAPVDSHARWLLAILAIAGLFMLILTLSFSTLLAEPTIPDSMHLSQHPPVPRIDEPVRS